MGLFSTLFNIGKKAFVPLVNIGKKAFTGLSGLGKKIGDIGTKIGNWWKGSPFKGTKYTGTKNTQKVADMFKAQRLARETAPPSISGAGVGGYTAKGGGFQYLPPRQPVDLLSKTPYKDTIVGLDF